MTARRAGQGSDGSMKVAILGTGGIADAHADAIAHIDGVELVAVADREPARAEAFAEKWGVPKVCGSLDELLTYRELESIHICTPQALHHEQAIHVLQAGRHAIVEKPPARSVRELDDMLTTADANQRVLAVVFQQRAGTAARHVKELLDSGRLGRPLLATCETLWFRESAYFDAPGRATWAADGGGVTIGLAIHQIDLLAWLLGDWRSVSAQLWRLDRRIECEDASTAVVAFGNGAVASVVSSALSPRQKSAIRIDTELATVTLEHLYGHGHDNWRITPAPDVAAGLAESWRFPADEEPSGHRAFLRELYGALVDGRQPPEVAEFPRRALEIVEAIYTSATTQRPASPSGRGTSGMRQTP